MRRDLYKMCACGIVESDCMSQQRREESGECCVERITARREELGITVCSVCGEPAHASETGMQASQRSRSSVCAVCGAVDGGSETDPDRRCVDCRVQLIYTNAPAAYDYWYATQIKECAGIDSAGKVWRCVRVAEDRVKAQSSRYQSGWHAAMPPRDWQKAVLAGVVTVPGGAS